MESYLFLSEFLCMLADFFMQYIYVHSKSKIISNLEREKLIWLKLIVHNFSIIKIGSWSDRFALNQERSMEGD